MNLRPYQQKTIDGIKQSVRAGNKRILVVSPTGSGKSWTIAWILSEVASRYKHAICVVHRREIIFQLSKHLDDFAQPHGLILAGERKSASSRVQVGSIQTFRSRHMSGSVPPADIVIIDEAHLSLAKSYRDMMELYPDSILIGFTATPVRGDGRGLGNLYQDLVLGADIEGLIKDGYLVPTRIIAPTVPDLTGVRVVAGDYSKDELAQAMDNKTLVGDAVNHWLEHASDRKTVVFTTGVAHSMHVCELFRAHGIKAEHIDGTTDKSHREEILDDLVHGDTKVVCNCDVLTTGWDAPVVSCMVMLRPTKSYGLYLQMAGRILRPSDGKKDALIIDHGGNVYRHGFPEDAGNWSLDDKEKIQDRKKAESEERQPITCRNCFTVYTGRRDCPECGWVPTTQSKVLDIKEGRLVEVKRKPREVVDKQRIWQDCLWSCVKTGRKCGAAAHMYRKKVGVWPRGLQQLPKGDQWKMKARDFIQSA